MTRRTPPLLLVLGLVALTARTASAQYYQCARLEAYRSIIGSGTETINHMHYFRNSAAMKAGDLVLMDYAPDYHYYVSDIGRVWPVNGTYARGTR